MIQQISQQNPLQGFFDALRNERAQTQMTLGGLIRRLEEIPPSTAIQPPINSAHSYRGYYSDLAFEPSDQPVTAGDLLKECRAAMGIVFEGYKGGDFLMGENTPVWVSYYGCCGTRIMMVNNDGSLVLADEED